MIKLNQTHDNLFKQLYPWWTLNGWSTKSLINKTESQLFAIKKKAENKNWEIKIPKKKTFSF